MGLIYSNSMPVYFSSPFFFPYLMYAMYVVSVICICHIKLYFVAIFNTRLLSKGLCECLYIFIGFRFHCTDCNGYRHLFRLPNMCRYFLLNPRIAKPGCCTRILWNPAREIKPYQILVFKPNWWMQACVFWCLNPSDGCKFVFFKVEIASV